jgi:hypothetical protein
VAANSSVILRHGLVLETPLGPALGFLEKYGRDSADPSGTSVFGEPNLRLANRQGARISAAQIEAILSRRRAIERALAEIAPDASLASPAKRVPWPALQQLFEPFAGIHGVGFSKMTKAEDDPGTQAPFAERAVALARGYKRDLDRNRGALRSVQRELARRDYDVSAVRLLDILIVTTR